jgi:hypothetical protein
MLGSHHRSLDKRLTSAVSICLAGHNAHWSLPSLLPGGRPIAVPSYTSSRWMHHNSQTTRNLSPFNIFPLLLLTYLLISRLCFPNILHPLRNYDYWLPCKRTSSVAGEASSTGFFSKSLFLIITPMEKANKNPWDYFLPVQTFKGTPAVTFLQNSNFLESTEPCSS